MVGRRFSLSKDLCRPLLTLALTWIAILIATCFGNGNFASLQKFQVWKWHVEFLLLFLGSGTQGTVEKRRVHKKGVRLNNKIQTRKIAFPRSEHQYKVSLAGCLKSWLKSRTGLKSIKSTASHSISKAIHHGLKIRSCHA